MNKIILAGKITGDIEFSHEIHNERFYSFSLSTNRKSGVADVVPCIVSEVFVDSISNRKDGNIKIEGEIRTRNVIDAERAHLMVFVFVNNIGEYGLDDENKVVIEGNTCKAASYRATPLGREVADIIVASNRMYSKSDYIPCIAWGRNAIKAKNLGIGAKIRVEGRFQSRQYVKKYENGNEEVKVAYEVSIAGFELMEDIENGIEG